MNIEILQSQTYKHKSVIVITDDCNETHRLLISNKDLNKSEDWFIKLLDKKLINKCISIDNSKIN